MNKPYDLILWGATGFTGRLVAEYLAGQIGRTARPFRWALAGRSQAKLEAVRQSLARIHPDAAELPLLLGDSLDRASMDALAAQARVVCSTVGPFLRYGTPLVAACATQGTDYCDITGETPWIRQNIDAFHTTAVSSGARIVHCCGYDSIPSDLGTLMVQTHAQETFGRPAQTVKHLIGPTRGGFSGGTVDRPAFQRLLADVDAGKLDAIVVHRLDRFSRSVADFA
ncbi:MAG: recombinase family protein, partial [Caldilineaceae bacterium]|nr:recombinase family protein [Caldilineaceae bacterium]